MPHKSEKRRLKFDIRRFDADFRRVCKTKGLTLKQASIATGVHQDTLYFMKCINGIPDTISMASLCKWSGLNIGDYSIDTEEWWKGFLK
jgi:hypothetical protein